MGDTVLLRSAGKRKQENLRKDGWICLFGPSANLGRCFANQSTDLWERLSYVRESYKSRGVLGPVRFGEETITDLLMMDLYVQGSKLAHFKQTSKPDEALWGTDFELWLGSGRLGWFRFAIQAKKLDLKSDRYASLTQANASGPQIDLLEQFARLNRAAPLYCLYNHSEDADEFDHWHCCTGPTDLRELGCSVTPASNIRTAIGQWKGKNFKSIHRRKKHAALEVPSVLSEGVVSAPGHVGE